MIDRIACGDIPAKHHIAHRGASGTLRYEECITRAGFDGPYTIVYHEHRPHLHVPIETTHGFPAPEAVPSGKLLKRHYRTGEVSRRGGAPIDRRVPLLFNEDITMSVLHPSEADSVYFSNGDGDDLYFILEGSGTLRSMLGDVPFEAGDYVGVPRGTLHRLLPTEGEDQSWFHLECVAPVGPLSKWRNDAGQFRMDAPYGHRDFRRPTFRGPMDEGIREVVVKREGVFHGFEVPHSPLDVVGWDGTLYPWAFPILNFQPRAGLVHLPPDWHGTFATRGALICSFVPRVVDFHPEAIPCPYPHSSVDCDEVIFYVRGNFTSRKGVGPASISHHPMGLPHGPHPGSYEGSLGTTRTDELAVMIDTLRPLRRTATARDIEDHDYMRSFL
ncbi:MAG: homogentisate 1,2-dioxygenase [Myxococcales bacterium]|nr:homogentisate 1,2-dioxygenase [Myxococcales bacterium]